MIRIRLARKGVKNKIFYRIVAAERHSKRGGAPLSVLGTWNPKKDQIHIDKGKLNALLAKGAKLTKALENILK